MKVVTTKITVEDYDKSTSKQLNIHNSKENFKYKAPAIFKTEIMTMAEWLNYQNKMRAKRQRASLPKPTRRP